MKLKLIQKMITRNLNKFSKNKKYYFYLVLSRMFFLTGSTTNFFSIALTLILIVAFWFPILVSITYDSKKIVQFKYQR